jgi:hypothetical protein
MYSSQQSQYHIQANAFQFQPELNNWTKVWYKPGRSIQDETKRSQTHQRMRKLVQPNFHFQSLHSSIRRPTAERRSWEHAKTFSNLYNCPQNISPLIQLLEQIAKLKLSQTIKLKFTLKLLNPTEQKFLVKKEVWDSALLFQVQVSRLLLDVWANNN